MARDVKKNGRKTSAKIRHFQFPKVTRHCPSSGLLFCKYCQIVLDHTRKSSVEIHLKTTKHKRKVLEDEQRSSHKTKKAIDVVQDGDSTSRLICCGSSSGSSTTGTGSNRRSCEKEPQSLNQEQYSQAMKLVLDIKKNLNSICCQSDFSSSIQVTGTLVFTFDTNEILFCQTDELIVPDKFLSNNGSCQKLDQISPEIHTQSEQLHPPPEAVLSPSASNFSPSSTIQSPSETNHAPSGKIHSLSETNHSPSETNLCSSETILSQYVAIDSPSAMTHSPSLINHSPSSSSITNICSSEIILSSSTSIDSPSAIITSSKRTSKSKTTIRKGKTLVPPKDSKTRVKTKHRTKSSPCKSVPCSFPPVSDRHTRNAAASLHQRSSRVTPNVIETGRDESHSSTCAAWPVNHSSSNAPAFDDFNMPMEMTEDFNLHAKIATDANNSNMPIDCESVLNETSSSTISDHDNMQCESDSLSQDKLITIEDLFIKQELNLF